MAAEAKFRLTVEQGPTPGEIIDLGQETIKIGRDPDSNTLVFSSPGISRQHALLQRGGDGYRLEDLGSANGTFVNDQRLAPNAPHLLRPGDRIRLGAAVALTFQAVAPAAAAHPGAAPRAAAPPPPAPPAPARPPAPPPRMPAQPVVSTGREGPARPYQPAPAPAGEPMSGATVFMAPEVAQPPQFIVETAGEGRQTFTLTDPVYTLGRAEDNTIHISSRLVSRHHARLERMDGGYRLTALPEAGNPLLFEGRPLTEPRQLKHNDLLRVGGRDPGTMVTITYVVPGMAEAPAPVSVDFGQRTEIQIGRDAANEVRLDVPAVSRFHAVIQRVGQRYRVRDLRSTNGTFVNDVRVDGEMWLNPNDSIRIGPYRFVLGQDALVQHDESRGMQVHVLGLNKWVRKDLNILQNIYLAIQPREFVVVVGLSGSGKSTLVDAVAGYRPATHGKVLVNGTDVYEHFDAVRNDIGFVPQRDIIHMELSVFSALDYAAQLRMPGDTTRQERQKRISEVLADLDLTERKNVSVARLSGGQQKRVSIGVELLTKPGLFFLDEPTSGLDPGTETALMQLMRRLADQGRTIILITHATKNVMLADKVLFLVRGGYVAWFGPPDEALKYFDVYRSERDRRAKDIEFDDIYNLLQDPSIGNPKEWSQRYQQHPAYQQYIVQPLQSRVKAQAAAPGAAVRAAPARPARRRRQVSSLRQFIILSMRNLNILLRDRFSLLLMLMTAPLVGFLTTAVAKPDSFDATTGDFPDAITGLFLMFIFAIIVGIMAQMREIVKEQDIYKRERLVNLKIFPYIVSKVWLAGLLALYHSAVYLALRYWRVDMPGSYWEFFLLYVTLTLATFAGMMLGLFASALAPNNNAAPLIATLFIVPQILLGGALLSLPSLGSAGSVLSSVVSSRWAFEAAMTITGIGKDVAADACWVQSEEARDAMEDSQKEGLCHCMGPNLFRDNNPFGRRCYFPGLQKFYHEAIDQPEPEQPPEPEAPGPPPALPEIPPPPALPAGGDPAAQQQFANDYGAWVQMFDQTQQNFKADTEAYQVQLDEFEAASDRYQEDIKEYQSDLAEWQGGRTGAIASGEELLGRLKDQFGHTYAVSLPSRWFFQLLITAVLFIGILILQKRKDVV